MGIMMVRRLNLVSMLLFSFSLHEGESDICPSDSTNLIRVCRPVTISNQIRYTMEFSDFELTGEDNCRCSFIAPSDGNFEMAPTAFTAVNNCGTKIVIAINNVPIPGGTNECRKDPFLPADVRTGENLTITISRTTVSSTKIAPYCYVATFPFAVTFTCTPVLPLLTADTTTAVHTSTSTTPTRTIETSARLPTTTTTTTMTPSISRVISSSPTSLKATHPSSTSIVKTDPSKADNQESFPLVIVIPAAAGGLVVIIIIIVVAVVCLRRSKKSVKQTTVGGYQNEVFNDKDSSSDGIKDNVLYNSMDANYPDMNGEADGHYSSVIRHSTKLDEDSHKMKELPQSANQESQGPVYAVVDKGQKRPSGPPVANKPSVAAQSENANAPVYAVPDKSQNKAKQGKNAVYDVPKNNSPVAPPVRTSNQDGLLYSEIEHVGKIPELPSRKSDPKPNDTVVYSEVRTEL